MTTALGTIALSAAQQAAIFSPGDLMVRAGAGSGKTEVLARRFVALLAGDIEQTPPLDPANIAAITFTEKAALDMSQRIATVLAERVAAEPDDQRRARLMRVQRTLWLARISTIHAFCARILRENPVAAAVDPDFEVLDDYESGALFERVARASLVSAVRRGDPGALFLVRSRRVRGNQFREGALEIMERILNETRRRGDTVEQMAALTAATSARLASEDDHVAACACQLIEAIDALLMARATTPRGAAQRGELAAWWRAARTSILALEASAEPVALERLRELIEHLPEARGIYKDLVPPIRALVASSDSAFGLRGELIAAWGERRACGPALDVARLIAEVGAAFDDAKRVERAMTFDDLLVATRDLLRDRPEVAARYQDELGALLVDEYQDTNGLQDEIITRLTGHLTGAGQHDSSRGPWLFIVGDEKQSIYRFRGADVSVFNAPRAVAPRQLPLTDNRRSTPTILRFVNALGAIMMRASDPCPPHHVRWTPAHELSPQRVAAHDYPVEFMVAIDAHGAAASGEPEAELATSGKRRCEARAIADLINGIIARGEPIVDPTSNLPRPAEARDCVVLFRAFTDIAIYERAFAAAGLASYTVNGRGFYGCREIVDLVQLMAAIDDPHDGLALAAALRSPLFGLSDRALFELMAGPEGSAVPRVSLAERFAANEPDVAGLGDEQEEAARARRTLAELRSLRGRVALSEFVERALELTDYESVMAALPRGGQRIANLRKLAELARRFDTRRFFTFHDFVVYLRRLTEEEPYEAQAQTLTESDNAVRLMTVHQAKGLEFPIVVLADAGRRPNLPVAAPLLEPEQGLLLCATVGSGYDEIPNTALESYRDRLKDEEAAESRRILYVALTRARDRLIISEGAGTKGWSLPLRELIGVATINKFLASGDDNRPIQCGAANVMLRRPDRIAPPPARHAEPVADSYSEVQLRRAERRLAFAREYRREQIFSPTALADFDRCPRQYWLRHGLGLPEDHVGGSSDGQAATMGSVAHRVLERIGASTDPEDAAAAIAPLVESLGGAAGLDAASRAMLARDLTRYAAAAPQGESIIGRELPFMLNPAPGLFVRGQIDLLVRDGATVVVRDYKYAAVPEAAHYQVQMECYALAAATAYRDTSVAAEIVALRGTPATLPVALPPPATIRNRIAALGGELDRAHAARDFPRRPASPNACHALGCGYIARCWKH